MTFINRKIYLIKSNNKDKIDNLWVKAKHPENVKNNILLAIFPDNIKPKSLTNLEKITYHIQDKKYYNIERYGNIDKVYTSGIYQFNFTGFINSDEIAKLDNKFDEHSINLLIKIANNYVNVNNIFISDINNNKAICFNCSLVDYKNRLDNFVIFNRFNIALGKFEINGFCNYWFNEEEVFKRLNTVFDINTTTSNKITNFLTDKKILGKYINIVKPLIYEEAKNKAIEKVNEIFTNLKFT